MPPTRSDTPAGRHMLLLSHVLKQAVPHVRFWRVLVTAIPFLSGSVATNAVAGTGDWTGNYLRCDRHSEILNHSHMNLAAHHRLRSGRVGEQPIRSVPVLFERAFNKGTGPIDDKHHYNRQARPSPLRPWSLRLAKGPPASSRPEPGVRQHGDTWRDYFAEHVVRGRRQAGRRNGGQS